MNDLKLESQGVWIANLANDYAFKIEPVGSSAMSVKQRFELASRIAKCVSAMAGIGDDNAMFAPGNSVRSVISTMELKRLELEQHRNELKADRDNWRNEARGLRESQERLWKQRDELLAVLKLCSSAMEGIEGPGFKEAKLAIAKAKGGAA